MNITAQTIKASLVPGRIYDLVIANSIPFVENGGTAYMPGEIVRQAITANSQGDLPIPALSGIPATNDVDIQYLSYNVALYRHGKNTDPIPFLFGDSGEQIVNIRINLTESGSTGWNDIKMLSQAHCMSGPFPQLEYFTTAQGDLRYVLASQYIEDGGESGDGVTDIEDGGNL